MLGRIMGETGKPLTFSGYANDFDKAIVALEFSLDEGATWTRHKTTGTTSDKLVNWTFTYKPEKPGLYRLHVRAVNEDNTVSPIDDVVEFEISDSKQSL